MDWFIVLALLLFGFAMIIVEVIFIPGTTFVGIIGIISAALGIYLSFQYFGSDIGWWFLIGSALLFAGALYVSFRGRTWDRFSLKDSNRSKFNEGIASHLTIALRGKTISNLRPIGKAEFDGQTFEVRSHGDYIDSGTSVEIIKIDGNRIYVQPIE